MFGDHYLDWNRNRLKAIIDFYSQKFFYRKTVLDLGAGYGDMGAVFERLGSEITATDVRADHLKIINKKFPNVKTVKTDLDQGWAFKQKKFDLILDLGVMCHLKNYEAHLRDVCSSTDHLVLETYVMDSEEISKKVTVNENKNIYDFSFNGICTIPTAAEIERILNECGMSFKRFDDSSLNSGNYVYDWKAGNTSVADRNKRRLWFAVKNTSPMQFKAPNETQLKPIEIPVIYNTFQSVPVLTTINNHNYSTSIDTDIVRRRRFVIVIPSYKNQDWCERNITSVLNQNYDKFRILFTDDCSPDATFEKVKNLISNHPLKNKVTLSKNSERKGALHNLHSMINSCEDDEIILTLDGDDWLANNEVLNKLNQEYCDNDIWMTYGQFTHNPSGGIGCSDNYSSAVVNNNGYRHDAWRASHLRTFYTWLFKSIKLEDLMQDGEFYKMTWDMAIMFPMLEMAGTRHKYISDILYVYNLENEINDHKVNRQLQSSLDGLIRSKQKYSALTKPNLTRKKVGLLLIATKKYNQFLQTIISSADNNFLTEEADITYYIFSDELPNIKTNGKIEFIPIKHVPFPYASMNRFKYFTENKDLLASQDYLYYSDVDCLFVNKITADIFGDLVGVRHCGYYNGGGTFENNTSSVFWSNPSSFKYYFGGGFSGGRTDSYLKLSAWCDFHIDAELSQGRMPLFHDETAINKFFLDNNPDVVLSPSYHYPQSNVEHYNRIWGGRTFTPKILLLDKNHSEIRS